MNAQITRSDQDCVAPGFGALNRSAYPAPLTSTLKPWGGPVEEEPVLRFLPAFFRSQNSSFTSHLLPLWGSLMLPGTIFRSPWSNLTPLLYQWRRWRPCKALQCVVTCVGQAPTKARREECWELASLSSSWKGQKVDLRVLSWGDPTSYPDTCWIPKDGWCWPRPSHSQFNRCACRRP